VRPGDFERWVPRSIFDELEKPDMTMQMNRRRALLAGAAVAAAASPAAAAGLMSAQGDTAVGKLWAQAQTLRGKLDRYAAEIAAAERQGGIPGWMRLSGEANALGEARYQALVKLLKSTPVNNEDVRLMARAAQDADMASGPRLWANNQVAGALDAYVSVKIG
jgi:hypothetical protein